MEGDERRRQVLRHCLWLASRDPAYAVHAAGWYEANEPWLLNGLADKVQQAIAKRAAASATKE